MQVIFNPFIEAKVCTTKIKISQSRISSNNGRTGFILEIPREYNETDKKNQRQQVHCDIFDPFMHLRIIVGK